MDYDQRDFYPVDETTRWDQVLGDMLTASEVMTMADDERCTIGELIWSQIQLLAEFCPSGGYQFLTEDDAERFAAQVEEDSERE